MRRARSRNSPRRRGSSVIAAADLRADRHHSPFARDRDQHDAGRFGMWLLLLSLAMLFGASLVAFLVIRIQLHDRWPSGQITLPRALWLSTAVMLASSATLHVALRAAQRDRQRLIAAGLVATFALGLAFLALQVYCWLEALAELRLAWLELETNRLAATGFYVFSGVHGLHVIGGLIPMSVVLMRALRGIYGPDRLGGLQYISMYWHFLDGVWIVLFATLLIGL